MWPAEPITIEQPVHPLRVAVSELEADYPQWRFAIRQGYGGPRIEAHRPHSATGLYALITADPAELRLELDNATPRRNRAGGSPVHDFNASGAELAGRRAGRAEPGEAS
jgi:hypothetical protein